MSIKSIAFLIVNKKDSMLSKTGSSSNTNTTKKRRKPTLTVAKKGSIKKKDKPSAAQSKAGTLYTVYIHSDTHPPSSPTLCCSHSYSFMSDTHLNAHVHCPILCCCCWIESLFLLLFPTGLSYVTHVEYRCQGSSSQ